MVRKYGLVKTGRQEIGKQSKSIIERNGEHGLPPTTIARKKYGWPITKGTKPSILLNIMLL